MGVEVGTMQKIVIPAPPVPLSASASLLQTVTINTQMKNIIRSSHKGASLGHVGQGEYILEFEPQEQQRSGRPVARANFARQVQYSKDASVGVRDDLHAQGITPLQRIQVVESCLEGQELVSPVGGRAAIAEDPGRQRAMCSSPRETAMRDVREREINEACSAQSFATSYKKEAFLVNAASAVAPKKAMALWGTTVPGMEGFDMQDADAAAQPAIALDVNAIDAPAANIGDDRKGSAGNESPRNIIGGSSSFKSSSVRFQVPTKRAPPVGHYTMRYKAIDGEPRAPGFTLRTALNLHGHGGATVDGLATTYGSLSLDKSSSGQVATAEPGAEDQQQLKRQQSNAASFIGGQQPQLSPREIARQRQNSAPARSPRSDAVFVSAAPRLAPPNVLPQSSKEAAREFYPPVLHHEEICSNKPRVHGVHFEKMSPRGQSAREKGSKDRFQVFMYSVRDSSETTIATDLHVQMDLSCMVSREHRCKGHLVEYDPEIRGPHVLAKGSSLDTRDIFVASRSVQPRVICSADIARASPRRTVTGLEHTQDALSDPDALNQHVFPKHVKTTKFELQLPHQVDIRKPVCQSEVYDVSYNSTSDSRHLRRIDVAGQSNHDDITSFGNQATRRILHGDVVDTVDSPKITAVRPNTSRLVPNFSREGVLRRAFVAPFPARPELEKPDPEITRPRVLGDPQMATASTRAQQEKRFPSGTKLLDVLYDPKCSYTAELLQSPRGYHEMTPKTDRKAPCASRVSVQVENRDPVPAPGTYDPAYHYLSCSPPKGRRPETAPSA